MLIDKTTNQIYKNRHEAKQALGHGKFNRLYKARQIQFLQTENSFAIDYEFIYSNTEHVNS